MSESEDWRRQRADGLRSGGDDWIVRPRPASAVVAGDDVLPMRVPPTGRFSPPRADPPTRAVDVPPADPVRARAPVEKPSGATTVRQPWHLPKWWPYAAAALGLQTVAVGWLLADRVQAPPVPATVVTRIVTASPARTAAVPAAVPSLPLDESRCSGPLAAAALSSLIRRGSAFDDTSAVAASDAAPTLTSVQLVSLNAPTVYCRGVLAMQLVEQQPGKPTLTQIVSGPVDYSVDPGATPELPQYRVLRARAIMRRLAATPVTVAAPVPAPAVATAPAPAASSPPPARAVPAPVAAVPLPKPPVVAAESQPADTAPVAAPAPARPSTEPPPVGIGGMDAEQAAQNNELGSLYAVIQHSNDPQAIAAAEEGRERFLRRRARCATLHCEAVAYKDWIDRLRDIVERNHAFPGQ